MDWDSIDFTLGIVHKIVAIASTIGGSIYIIHLRYKEKKKHEEHPR